ncbi:MAG: helix-turn-helix domain-containing protein [Firmicutes bacterium]|nr:helix-turn-helix domain-containing protein [Bacillota bacterium]
MKASKIFGNKIRNIRLSHKMKQSEFAHEIGVEASQISRMECGKKGTSLLRLALICEKFDVPMDYFVDPQSSDSTVGEKWVAEIKAGMNEMSIYQVGMVKEFVDRLKE